MLPPTQTLTPTPGAPAGTSTRINASLPRFIHAAFWAISLILGLIDTLANRHSMGPDGISYLDIADAFRRGEWSAGFNLNWSPLYPLWLRLILGILRPSPYWEFAAVHVANFLLYLGALISFTVFLNAFVTYISHAAKRRRLCFPASESTWIALGYALFLWSSLRMITIANVTPDMCLSIFLYLASAIVLRIGTGKTQWHNFVWLGLVLGIGYMAKTPMFPLAFMFLTLGVLAAGDFRQGLRKGLLAAAIFFALVSPFIYHLSKSAGHLTFGESGRLIYSFYENAAPKYYWQSPAEGSSTLGTNPARQLFANPAAYEFALPAEGTYPYWYNPAQWYKGFHTTFNARAIARQLFVNALVYYRLFFHVYPAIPLSVLILLLLSAERRTILTNFARQWILLAVPFMGLAMFAFVFAEPRYVAVFVVLFLLGIFAGIRLPDSRESQKAFWAVICTLVASILLPLATTAYPELGRLNLSEFAHPEQNSSNPSWQVANGLRRVGIQPGARIAWVRPRYFTEIDNYWWARLAKLQIIGEVPDGDAFWAVSAPARAAAVRALGAVGARGVVVSHVPDSVQIDDAVQIGSSSYYVYLFPQ
jgi:hypothetical protein